MKFRMFSMNNEDNGLNVRRRSFLWKTGAAVSAMFVTSSAGVARPGTGENMTLKKEVERLSGRLGIREDENSIRALHHAYGCYLDRGRHREIVGLFTGDGEVVFNGGIFTGREQGVRRLYADYFGKAFMGDHNGPVHGCLLDHPRQQDVIEIAPDRNTATARFHCLIQAQATVDPDTPHIDMARLQGLDVRRWWEGGVYENTYVKDGATWKIKRLEYRPVWQDGFPQGRGCNRPVVVRPFAKTYPEDPLGPDRLITPEPKTDGETVFVNFLNFPTPATGELWKT